MAKIIISTLEESISAANPYISADGMVDITAIGRLAGKINASNKKVIEAAKKDGAKPPKGVTYIFYTRKDLPKYSASLEKKNDHKYKTLRGQQIKSRGKMPSAESNVKLKVLLPAALDGVDKSILAEIKKALSAVTSHNKKADRVVTKVKTEKGKIRDAANAEFDKNVQELSDILGAGGVTPANIVIGQSMFGKVMHVKLPSGGVVSIGKSDMGKLRAAKKMAAAS